MGLVLLPALLSKIFKIPVIYVQTTDIKTGQKFYVYQGAKTRSNN